MSTKDVFVVCEYDICTIFKVNLFSKQFNHFDNNIEDAYKQMPVIVSDCIKTNACHCYLLLITY